MFSSRISFKNHFGESMKQRVLYFVLLFLSAHVVFGQFENFITKQNDKLMDGDKEFRFISFNIPNLHYIEDNFPFDETNPWRLPDEFEIRDALSSINQIGGKVVRTYVITVKRDVDIPGMIKHVEAPGKFNEEAFIALDKMMQIANEMGVRLIIPLVDNWWWMGGRAEYAAFRGKTKDEFWTDPQLIEDFENTIKYVVNRKNTFTGVLYKDDKSILGWETGNELQSPYSWQAIISAYIQSVDTNHLVIINPHTAFIDEQSIADTNIDVVSTHYYESSETAIPKILRNRELTKGKKPYFVGEFGFIPSYEFESIFDSVIDNGISGALLWSLRFRNKDGGFYKHYEKSGFSAYNWPGYYFNESYNEKAVLSLIRDKAHKIDNKSVQQLPKPIAPKLLPTDNVHKISWQGSAGAILYVIQRKEEGGDWEIIEVTDDTHIAYRPLFTDTSAVRGKNYYYTMWAWNGTELSELSNEIGPIAVNDKMIIDELFDETYIYKMEGNLQFLSMENVRQAKEDRSRLTGEDNNSIVYKTNREIKKIQIDAFLPNENAKIEILIADKSQNFNAINADVTFFPFSENDYGFFIPARYSNEPTDKKIEFVKIVFTGKAELSRVEIIY